MTTNSGFLTAYRPPAWFARSPAYARSIGDRTPLSPDLMRLMVDYHNQCLEAESEKQCST
jgi:hypothetical protein